MCMFMKTIRILLLSSVTIATTLQAQQFVNLGFENAQPGPFPPAQSSVHLDWNIAAPGWGHSSGFDTGYVYYGAGHIGSSQMYLLLSQSSYSPPLAGQYSLTFHSGYETYGPGSVPAGPWVNAFISQTGTISSSARSLQLLATGLFKVFLGGLEIPMLSLGDNRYGGDITSFAGTVAELKIVNDNPARNYSLTTVDSISFSAVTVPEPNSLTIALLGSLAIFAVPRRTSQE